MKSERKIVLYIIYIVIGITLWGLYRAGIVDEYWSGMGGGLIVLSVLRMIQFYRLRQNDVYREKMEIEANDERNRFIKNKAWAWAGYLFILIAGVCTIVLKVLGYDQLSLAAAYGVCLVMILYYISYIILKRKY